MDCFTCNKRTGNYKSDKITCGACREVLKIDLVNIVLGLDPIYLSESNRNKKGRKPKLTATEQNDIKWLYNHNDISMEKFAKKYGVKKSTIFNIIHK